MLFTLSGNLCYGLHGFPRSYYNNQTTERRFIPMSVTQLINRYRETTSSFNTITKSDSVSTIIRRAMWTVFITSDINKQLKACKDGLDKGFIVEPFYGKFWKESENYQKTKNDNLIKDLQKYGDIPLDKNNFTFSIGSRNIVRIKDFIDVIMNSEAEMNQYLDAIKANMLNLHPDVYGRFYLSHKEEFDESEVVNEYLNRILSEGRITTRLLKSLQTEAVADALKMGIMLHDTEAKTWELDLVDLERVKKELRADYEYPENFKEYCARFRRYIVWRDDILIINHNDLGEYICRCSDQFTVEQIKEIFRLEVFLYLIHKDMVRLQPELAAFFETEGSSDTFGIINAMSRLMMQDWFKEFRTDNKYDDTWIKQMMTDLLDSEHRQSLLDIWQNPKKRLWLKAALIGCVKDAGVLKGSYLKIATAIINGSHKDNNNFSNYMGQGKNEPFFEWFVDYANC